MENLKSIKELFEDVKSLKIVLPDFQRDFVWEIDKQKKLLASTLVNLSIGSLLLVKGKPGDFKSKKIGYAKNNEVNSTYPDCSFLLDGQQRLSCVWSFFNDPYIKDDQQDIENSYEGWEDVWDSLYGTLKTRWFVNIKGVNGSDFFGYNNLDFDSKKVSDMEPNDILPQLYYEKILKSKNFEWYHPNYFKFLNKSEDDNKQKKYSAEQLLEQRLDEAQKSQLVPLYSLMSNDKFYSDVIDYLANERRFEIEHEIKNEKDFEKRKQLIIKYFKKIDPKIIEKAQKWNKPNEDLVGNIIDDLYKLAATWSSSVRYYFETILEMKINIIELNKSQIHRAIAIFTAINEGGQKLSTFDLVVAKTAKVSPNESLIQKIRTQIESPIDIVNKSGLYRGEDDISGWTTNYLKCINKDGSIDDIYKDSFLNILSIIVNSGFASKDKNDFCNSISVDMIKARKQLSMTPEQINDNFSTAITALQRALAFLQFRCGIVSLSDIPYKLMLIPISICLLEDQCWQDKSSIDKIEAWYWTSIFNGLYRDNQNLNSIKDAKYLYKQLVLKDKDCYKELMVAPIPSRLESIFEASEYTDKDTLCKINDYTTIKKQVSKAMLQYVLSCCPVDFLPDSKYQKYQLTAWNVAKCSLSESNKVELKKKDGTVEEVQLKLQDHHIFPLGDCSKLCESSSKLRKDKSCVLNSPLNRTYISDKANNIISDKSPVDYYSQLSKDSLSDHFAPYHEKAYSGKEVKDFNMLDEDQRRIILEERFERLKTAVENEVKNLLK